jgi:hypothetical protein
MMHRRALYGGVIIKVPCDDRRQAPPLWILVFAH